MCRERDCDDEMVASVRGRLDGEAESGSESVCVEAEWYCMCVGMCLEAFVYGLLAERQTYGGKMSTIRSGQQQCSGSVWVCVVKCRGCEKVK